MDNNPIRNEASVELKEPSTMMIVVEIEIPDGAITHPGHILGMRDHVRLEAQRAAKDYLDNEVNPNGCWCTEIVHQESCRHHVIPY